MVGIHKIYFENGKLKGIVNYDKKTILEYDSHSKQLYNTSFSDVKTHQQSIEKIYFQ